MPDETPPLPVGEVVTTLEELYRHQNRPEIAEVLERSHARLDLADYDNWNGGTYTWALRLEVPVPVRDCGAPTGRRRSGYRQKLESLSRQYPNDYFGEVTITPIAAGVAPLGQRLPPADAEVRHLWREGQFRLFLSHVATHRVPVSKLKAELALHGVAGFVAHDDIQPSRVWQQEIELALRSMHALAALITDDFHASSWTTRKWAGHSDGVFWSFRCAWELIRMGLPVESRPYAAPLTTRQPWRSHSSPPSW